MKALLIVALLSSNPAALAARAVTTATATIVVPAVPVRLAAAPPSLAISVTTVTTGQYAYVTVAFN